jgi:hypothetical protein
VSTEEHTLEPGEDAGLEPLGRYRSNGMSSTMRNIFDVLYEAGEPLSPETIAQRTYERASGASQFHARRAVLRERTRQRATQHLSIAEGGSKRERSVAAEWPMWIKKLLRDARTRHVLVRDENGRYSPNPAKPPRAMHVDGTIYAYTREAWLETTQEARTTGEIHTMTMEVERFLGGRSRDELLLVLEVFVDDLSGFTRGKGKGKRRPLDPRTVRSQLRWLLERPTTDESRAWLLHELVRRIYETS